MLREIIIMIGGLLTSTILGVITGLYISAFIGGNYMTAFEFNGVRGYEATGQIGAFVGFVIRPILGIIIALMIDHRKRSKVSR